MRKQRQARGVCGLICGVVMVYGGKVGLGQGRVLGGLRLVGLGGERVSGE
jgi:hypothetical protein